MEYELKHKYSVEAAASYLADEDRLRHLVFNESIYAHDGVGEGLYGFSYDRLWQEEFRNRWLEVIRHPSRAEMMPRIYGKCLAVASFTGTKFIKELTDNMISCITANAAKKNKKALESCTTTLEQFFEDNACLWFCILAYDVYKHNQLDYLVKLAGRLSS